MKTTRLLLLFFGCFLIGSPVGCRQDEKKSESAKAPADPKLDKLKAEAIDSVKNAPPKTVATKPAAPLSMQQRARLQKKLQQKPKPQKKASQGPALRPTPLRPPAARKPRQAQQKPGQPRAGQKKPRQTAATDPIRRIPPSVVSLPETPTAAQKAKEKAAAEADEKATDMERRQQALDAAKAKPAEKK